MLRLDPAALVCPLLVSGAQCGGLCWGSKRKSFSEKAMKSFKMEVCLVVKWILKFVFPVLDDA